MKRLFKRWLRLGPKLKIDEDSMARIYGMFINNRELDRSQRKDRARQLADIYSELTLTYHKDPGGRLLSAHPGFDRAVLEQVYEPLAALTIRPSGPIREALPDLAALGAYTSATIFLNSLLKDVGISMFLSTPLGAAAQIGTRAAHSALVELPIYSTFRRQLFKNFKRYQGTQGLYFFAKLRAYKCWLWFQSIKSPFPK